MKKKIPKETQREPVRKDSMPNKLLKELLKKELMLSKLPLK